MKTLQGQLEKRASDKLNDDIKELRNAIEKLCLSKPSFDRIARSVSFTNTKGDQRIDACDIDKLLYKGLVTNLIRSQLLDYYIDEEVESFLQSIEKATESK